MYLPQRNEPYGGQNHLYDERTQFRGPWKGIRYVLRGLDKDSNSDISRLLYSENLMLEEYLQVNFFEAFLFLIFFSN